MANGLNGLQTLSFDGTHDHLESSTVNIPQPITLFTVLKLTGGSGDKRVITGQSSASRAILSMAETSKLSLWSGSWASSNFSTPSATEFVTIGAIFDGSNSRLILNGSTQSGLNPGTQGLTSGLLIGANWNHTNEFFGGQIAEIIIFNKHSPQTEREEVEGYLAQKWGLTGSLTNGHSSLIKYKDDTTSGTGQSLDLSNGVSAVVKTGGTENVFDPGYTFSTSMWVKGWPSAAGESILAKNDFNPGSMGNLKSWFDASEANFLSTAASTSPPNDDDSIFQWYDLSGNGHHAKVKAGTPKWDATGFNSKPGVMLNGAGLVLDDSKIAFDAWSKLHVFIAFYQPGDSNFSPLFGKSNYAGWMGNDKDMGWSVFTHRLDGGFNHWGIGAINSAASANIYLNSFNKALQGADGGAPGMFTIKYAADGGFWGRMNGGSQETSSTAVVGGVQSKTGLDFTIGVRNDGTYANNMAIGEFIIFNDVISDADRNKIEGYLAHKWNLTSTLPTGHAYKSSAPAFGGWAIERASTGVDNVALNMAGAGDEFSKSVPINDNEWHHIVTTYGGAHKKIYVDGVEVATAAQTGGVTASTFKLTLGDPNLYGGSATRPRIDDVRYYSVVLTAAEVAAIYNEGENDVGAQKFSVTSPSTIQGAVGKSVSYQITTDAAYGMTGYNAAITYTLLNKPSWLSVNGSTGAVSGTPPSAGTYSFQAKATNTLGTGIKDVTITVSDYANWNYALPFTTDYAGGSALQDWNMLVRLSEGSSNGAGSAGFRYSQLSPNGGDLRFVSKAGEELKYEIANWNTAGESQVWVRVPSLASDENVTMYWGNTNAGLPAYANNGSTWDGYFGVYHLEGTTGSAVDSSPLSNNLPGVNAPVLEASGLSGTAYSSTSAANNGFISSALSGNIKAKNGTYSLWINHSPNVANKHFFGMEYNNDASNYLYVVGGTASANKARVWVAGGSTGFAGISTPTTTLSGGWQMLTLVINNGYAQVYVDGTADGSSAWYHPGLDAVSGLAIGRGTADAGPDATFDEATFSTAPRTADWLLASYNNQKPSSTYLNFGSLLRPNQLGRCGLHRNLREKGHHHYFLHRGPFG